jgi:hypothetical protein
MEAAVTRSPRRRALVRAGLRRGDTGSLAMSLTMTILALSLSALLVPMVVTQVSSTRFATQRVDALNAAQTGLDVGLGQIRAAVDGAGDGQRNLLPCGKLEGSLDSANAQKWSVEIYYLMVKPPPFPNDPNHTARDAWLQANGKDCIAGSGMMTMPSYAFLLATGIVPTVGTTAGTKRSLQATYTFQTTNANIPGGLIHAGLSSTGGLCLDATTATAGAELWTQTCAPDRPQQQFAYTEDLTLVLVTSKSPKLCLDAGQNHAVGIVVKLAVCESPVPPKQRWSANAQANFEGTADGRTPDGYCFNVTQPGTPGKVILGSGGAGTCYGWGDPKQTFLPEAAVGAGAAGPKTRQLVNFKQFGRCLDVPNNAAYFPAGGSLIAWPCKQAFEPADLTAIGWNQQWTLPAIVAGATSATGHITAQDGANTYCLLSPVAQTSADQHVALAQTCGTASTMTWTVYGETGRYEDGYRIMNHYGYCMAVTDPATDAFDAGRGISNIKVEPCTDSTGQKWNAPPDVVESGPLSEVSEG